MGEGTARVSGKLVRWLTELCEICQHTAIFT